MFPAGFWSRERVRRFALQLEGERWASACPPLTARSRRPRTKPLATDGPPTDLDIGTFLRAWLCATACGAAQCSACTPCERPPSRKFTRGREKSSALAFVQGRDVLDAGKRRCNPTCELPPGREGAPPAAARPPALH